MERIIIIAHAMVASLLLLFVACLLVDGRNWFCLCYLGI